MIFSLVFSFAACTSGLQPEDNQIETPSQEEVITDSNANQNENPTQKEPESNSNTNQSDPPLQESPSDSFSFVPCKLLYWEISPSVDADTQLQERVFSMSELQSSIEYQRNAAPFEEFNSDFFEEKSLLIYRFTVPYSGGKTYLYYAYTLDNGNSITVKVSYVCGFDINAGNVLMLVELNRDEYTDIKVHVSIDGLDFTDDDVLIMLTKEATDATFFHDYTVEDFPELNAVAVEELTIYTTARVRQCLLEDPTGGTVPDHLKNIKRGFVIRLAEKSKENVLRAVNILLGRKDLEYAAPNYYNYPD